MYIGEAEWSMIPSLLLITVFIITIAHLLISTIVKIYVMLFIPMQLLM